MNRISDFEIHSVAPMILKEGQTILLANLQEEIQGDPSVSPGVIQRTIRMTRTDLDSFLPEEIHLLIKQGYDAARHTFRNANTLSNGMNGDRWSPIPNDKLPATTSDYERALRKTHQSRLRLWEWKDYTSWIALIPLLSSALICLLLINRLGEFGISSYDYFF